MNPTGIRISVIVPVRNRLDVLRDLLSSFEAQTMEPRHFEVIVVDDCSSDGTAELVHSRAELVHFRLILCPLTENRGPVYARNAAAALAVGEVLAFTDSDCRVAPDWLEVGLSSFVREPAPAFVSGIVLDKPEQPVRVLSLRCPRNDREDPTYRACNIFYRKGVFELVGGFDMTTYLGDFHFLHFEFGDIELAWRLKRLGYQSRFEPRLIVFHEVWTVPLKSWLIKHTQQGPLPLFLKRYPEAAPLFVWRDPFLSCANALWYLSNLGWLLGLVLHPAYFFLVPAFFTLHLAGPAGSLLLRRPTRAIAILVLEFLGQSVACAALMIGSIKARRLVL